MDESKNVLLSELFAAFNTNDLLKSFNGRIDSDDYAQLKTKHLSCLN